MWCRCRPTRTAPSSGCAPVSERGKAAARRTKATARVPEVFTRCRLRPSGRITTVPIMNGLQVSRRAVLGGVLGGAAGLALGGTAAAEPGRGRRPRVLVATNEPWGTYHVKPLLAEVARREWQLTQLVPDYTQITPGDPVRVATPADAPEADLLVVTGAGDWPADCAARFRRLPLAASALAYQKPVEAPRARELRPRIRLLTSSSPAEGRAFAQYLGTRRPVRAVGSPQTDGLPARRPEPDLVLVLTPASRTRTPRETRPRARNCCWPVRRSSPRRASGSWSVCTRARTAGCGTATRSATSRRSRPPRAPRRRSASRGRSSRWSPPSAPRWSAAPTPN